MQIPILDDGINIHEQRVADDLRPFHQRIKDCFDEYRAHVLTNYGKAEAYEVAYRRRPPPRVHQQQQQQQPQQHAIVSYVKQDGAERRTSDSNAPDGVVGGDTDSDESLHGVKMTTSIKNSMGSRIASNSLLGSVTAKTFSPNKWINSAGKHLSNSSSGSGSSNSGGATNVAQQPSQSQQHAHRDPLLNGGSVSSQQQQIELSQELTPKRPPRPSVDAKSAAAISSRPPSDGSLNNGHSKEALHGGAASSTMHNSHSLASTTFSESIGSPTDSTDGDVVPPPLPTKGDHISICSNTSGTGISLGVDSVGHGDFSLLPQIQASLSSMALGGASAELSPAESAAPPAVPRKGEAPPPSLPGKKGRISIQGLNQI